jgi:hypothetical protein
MQTEHQVSEAQRRNGILAAVLDRLAAGESQNAACRAEGVPVATFLRWEKAYRTLGYNGLVPRTTDSGRKSALEASGATDEEIQKIKALALDTKSVTAAMRVFAQSDQCSAELADWILRPRSSKHALPKSLRRAVRPTPAEVLAHQGPRALGLRGMWTPRHCDILPGDIFSSDDTTPIWAWWVAWPGAQGNPAYDRASCEYRYGVKLLQGQFLPIMDVASQCITGFVLIARDKSSYRAADIWQLFHHTFETVGLPRLGWQLERGSWDSTLIRGAEIETRDGEASHTRRVGGLRQLHAADVHQLPPQIQIH